LPLAREHLARMADWIGASDGPVESQYPLKAFTRAVENNGPIPADDAALRNAVSKVARLLRNSHGKELPKLGHDLETLLAMNQAESGAVSESAVPQPVEPSPSIVAVAGSPNILVQLKQFLGLVPEQPVESLEVGFDHFPLRSDSPLRDEHELINMFLP